MELRFKILIVDTTHFKPEAGKPLLAHSTPSQNRCHKLVIIKAVAPISKAALQHSEAVAQLIKAEANIPSFVAELPKEKVLIIKAKAPIDHKTVQIDNLLPQKWSIWNLTGASIVEAPSIYLTPDPAHIGHSLLTQHPVLTTTLLSTVIYVKRASEILLLINLHWIMTKMMKIFSFV